MKVFQSVAFLLLFGAVSNTAFSQEQREENKSNAATQIPIYLIPFYDSNGPKISVGEHSDQIASADAVKIRKISDDLKAERDELRAETMYVLAIRLYDLGLKDEAAYWFYTAQYRGRVVRSILDRQKIGSIGTEAFELDHAYDAFNQLVGPYINGYAFGNLPMLEKTLNKVIEEGKTVPNYANLYPKVSFVPQDKWVNENTQVSDGLLKLIDYIKNNADSIKQKRKETGVEGKY